MANSLLIPQTYSELMKWADMAAKSDMVPKGLRGKPADIVIVVQYGSQLGMTLMESLRGIAVINGTPSVFGDTLLGLCKRHAEFEDCIETPLIAPTGDVIGYTCEVRRKGHKPVIHKFDVEDAKRAKLLGKAGPWTEYPQRMFQMRARSWALRDQFADMLSGVIAAEEAGDFPTIDSEADDKISKPQLDQLVNLLTETNYDSTSFLGLMFTGITSLEDIPAADFHRCLTALLRKKASMPKEPAQ